VGFEATNTCAIGCAKKTDDNIFKTVNVAVIQCTYV